MWFLEHGLPFFDIGSLTTIEKPSSLSLLARETQPPACLISLVLISQGSNLGPFAYKSSILLTASLLIPDSMWALLSCIKPFLSHFSPLPCFLLILITFVGELSEGGNIFIMENQDYYILKYDYL